MNKESIAREIYNKTHREKDSDYLELKWEELMDFRSRPFYKVAQYIIDREIKLLEDYTSFLVDHSYCDTDVYCEEPKAIDKFLKELK